MPSVALAPRAQLDIESIVLYLGAVCKQPEAARRIADELYGAIERLADFPLMGEPFSHDELQHDYRRVLVSGYWLYYEVSEDGGEVTVRRIFHERQDIDDFALVDF